MKEVLPMKTTTYQLVLLIQSCLADSGYSAVVHHGSANETECFLFDITRKSDNQLFSGVSFMEEAYEHMLHDDIHSIPDIANYFAHAIIGQIEAEPEKLLAKDEASFALKNKEAVLASVSMHLCSNQPAAPFFVLNYMDSDLAFRFGVRHPVHPEIFKWIAKQDLDNLGISVEELTKAADVNTQINFPAEVLSIANILGAKMSPDVRDVCIDPKMNYMITITNEAGLNGSGAILYPGVKERVATMLNTTVDHIVVIPSSVHEVICVSDDIAPSIEDMTAMIQDVNSSLNTIEVLASHPYRFDGDDLISA